MKKIIKYLIKSQRKLFITIIKKFNHHLRRLTAWTHKCQLYAEWAISPNPEWFDHFIDQHYQWSASGNSLCWERGVYSLLGMRNKARVLDICCGDGFNAFHFYAIRAQHITAIDFDPAAIAHANKHFKKDNIDYKVVDIRKDFPQGQFTNIIWDGAIEHFTLNEMANIFKRILSQLTPDGILSGYTIVEDPHGPSHDDHEYEFKSKNELKEKLKENFKHVVVFDTIYPNRHNLYFYASNQPLTFLNDFVNDYIDQQQKPNLVESAVA